jgi:polysaccharide pyruvyl transferase CsaB
VSRVGILGSYGGLNIGDEAILAATVASLRDASPYTEIVVFSRDAGHTRHHHPVDVVVDARSGFRDAVVDELSRLDLLLLGGGGLLHDGEARVYLADVRAAHSAQVPTVAYAVGVGPLTDQEDRAAVRDVVSGMRRITVRDEASKRMLNEVGVTGRIEVAADPALLLRPEPVARHMLAAEGIPADEHLIGMSVREPGRAASDLPADTYHSSLAAVADFMVHRYGAHIVFIPMERQDLRHSHAVVSKMLAADRTRVLNGCYSPGQILGLMQHLEFVVGMRLHVMLFAGMSGIPFLPLPYAAKVAEFARAAGVPALPGLDPEYLGPLLATVDDWWDTRHEHGRAVAARLDRLLRRARRPLDVALEELSTPITSLPSAPIAHLPAS